MIAGARRITPTPINEFNKFVSVTGSGTAYTQANPGVWTTGISTAVPGDKICMLGGQYPFVANFHMTNSGTATDPILIEGYPGKIVRFDGSSIAPGGSGTFEVLCNYTRWRNVGWRKMPNVGVRVSGNYNILEGVQAYDNYGPGIKIISDRVNPYDLVEATGNIIRDFYVYRNFDEGTPQPWFNNGGNADGITCTNGTDTLIEYGIAFDNSDDGYDIWKTQNGTIRFCIAHHNGYANGNGNGFKSGSIMSNLVPPRQNNSIVEYCLGYSNKTSNFDCNGSDAIIMRENESFNSGYYNAGTWVQGIGYRMALGATMLNNKSSGKETATSNTAGSMIGNSWQ